MVSSTATPPSSLPAVFPTCSRSFSISRHSQAPNAATSVSPMSNCLPPASHYPVPLSHQNSCVSLLPPYIAQQSYTVHGSPQMHYPSSTPPFPGISSISPTTCLSQDSFFLSQGFSTVYPNVPMSQGYPNSQFPFSQHFSDSVNIPSHPPNSCISNLVHVDTSVPPPSFPPTHNMDCRLPMVHKTANPTSLHCKLNELVPSNTSINASSSSSSGSSFDSHNVS